MTNRFQKLGFCLLLLAFLLAACVNFPTVTIRCDSATVRYELVVVDSFPQGTYRFEAYRLPDNVLVGVSEEVEINFDNPTGSVDVEYDQDYEVGTQFRIDAVYLGPGSPFTAELKTGTCAVEPEDDTVEVTWCDVAADGRINNQCYAYAAVYCDDTAQRVAIYGIPPMDANGRSAGQGFPAIFVNYSDLPPTPTTEQGNQLISQFENIAFYRLTTGEYQVNAGPDAEGKSYVVIWDGCPWNTVSAYILQNGVMTQTEVYPHQ